MRSGCAAQDRVRDAIRSATRLEVRWLVINSSLRVRRTRARCQTPPAITLEPTTPCLNALPKQTFSSAALVSQSAAKCGRFSVPLAPESPDLPPPAPLPNQPCLHPQVRRRSGANACIGGVGVVGVGQTLLAAFARRRVDRAGRGDALAHTRRCRAAHAWVAVAAALQHGRRALWWSSPLALLSCCRRSLSLSRVGDARATRARRVHRGWFSPPQSSKGVFALWWSSPLTLLSSRRRSSSLSRVFSSAAAPCGARAARGGRRATRARRAQRAYIAGG